ncbi:MULTISPECIES: hypothetical protein [Yersinia]|nr:MULTISPECIES: hypothetical protein [Yersinia]
MPASSIGGAALNGEKGAAELYLLSGACHYSKMPVGVKPAGIL